MADDFREPPAKRARFDAPSNGAFDVPGSPIDDMDDDFYETDPVKPLSPSLKAEDRPLTSDVAPSTVLSSLNIPGLGLLSGTLAATPQQQDDDTTSPKKLSVQEEAEEGELSEIGSLYNEHASVVAARNGQQPEVYEITTAAQLEEAISAALLGAPSNEIIAHGQASEHPPSTATANVQPDGLPQPAPVVEGLEKRVAKIKPSQTRNDADNTEPDAPLTVDDLGQQDTIKTEFLQAGEANRGDPTAEWQLDSSDAESLGDSSSVNSDDSSLDDEGSDEGELLDPEEQVRRLMMEAADDPGTICKGKVRTLNEVTEEYSKPEITMTEKTKITELGKVESIVDNLVLIKAKVSGDYQVLGSGSPLCLENRTIIGKVSETLGRVHEPRYSVGFNDPSEIASLGITENTCVFYVDDYSTFVFTEPLKAQKFTDASNLHDEETNEVEFSDDEKEAEYKRKQKETKKAKADANRSLQETASQAVNTDVPPVAHSGHYQGGGLNYSDDDDENLGMYKPLARPDHFEDIVGAGAPVEDRSHVRRGPMRGRGGWPERGRGFRGRGGGALGGGRGNQGNRFFRGSDRPDRGGRQQEHSRPRNPVKQEKRSASSASPRRQNQRKPSQGSPPRGNSSNRRKGRFTASPAPSQHQPTPSNATATAYSQNSSINSNGWSMPPSSNAYPASNAHSPSSSTPSIPPGSYVNPAFYASSTPAQSQTQYQGQQQAPEQTMANWAQWLQLAAAMSQSQQGQAQPQPQPHTTPNYNAQQNSTASGTPSLQDILRTLGGGSRP
ncbi:NAF1-domain-containing protein [Lojkania enalia]|uniref:H/ACA ribonucleoprotein complex non-core subunit NAF1 n=1 Tax=Lojkania enalia TaxID=147567 RepID=A0A9P4N887_9PLEO|nr:NAF1-domain-containing protein [Didymosphaeria enalia]